METKPWITFFSQTGAEIADIAEALGRWPDVIITNKRPDHLRTIDKRILDSGKLHWTANKPEVFEYTWVLDKYEDPVVTLHGWLRVVPEEVCNKYKIYNGHPGLITEYPELKGKDPQVRAFQGMQEGKYPIAGAVIHKVVAGVDEGKVIMQERFNTFQLELDDLFRILRDRSLYMWHNFLKKVL
jgi:folate-dependent phosphoribosylglycinamide formyltransferase PurN